VAATDDNGNVLWREMYTPFGSKLENPTANRDNEGYTGHIDDSGTGLTYMQARFYDPAIGRFLSNDPVGFMEGGPAYFNRYAYTANDPMNYVDPTGESIVENETKDNIIVRGNLPDPNGDDGSGSGEFYWGVVAPGETGGGEDNPVAAFETPEEAIAFANGDQSVTPVGEIEDIDDFVDPDTNRLVRTRGDDKGPIVTVARDERGRIKVTERGEMKANAREVLRILGTLPPVPPLPYDEEE